MRPNLKQYLIKLAPDPKVLELTQKYALENNITGEFKDVFYYNENITNISTSFYRGFFAIEFDNPVTISLGNGFVADEDYVIFSPSNNSNIIYLIAASNDEVAINFSVIQNITGYFTVSGVAF